MATTAREHLDWAIERALQYYDTGDPTTAITSFISDVGKHEGTSWIQVHPLGVPFLLLEVNRGRDAFKAAMSGYGV